MKDFRSAPTYPSQTADLTLNILRKILNQLAPMSKNTGVIGVSAALPFDRVDKKLNALLTKSTQKQLLGKLIIITGESKSYLIFS